MLLYTLINLNSIVCLFFLFRFEIPGEKSVRLSEKFESKIPTLKYYGAGLEQGECGATVPHVKSTNNGPVKCFLGLESDEIEGQIDLIVACK